MKRLGFAGLCAAGLLLALGAGVAWADTAATAFVGTVNGNYAFDIQNAGTQLYYQPQPDTNYYWLANNGTAPGTILTYTYNGVTSNRDGMKTYAATDIAYGQTLDSIKMSFDYYTGADPTTGINMVYYPSINFVITDGSGHYGIWSPTSGGTPYSTTDLGGGWSNLTLDCTTLTENTWGKVNEYNGGLSTSQPEWSVIKGWTIAGFYDYEQAPQGGFGAWGSTLWGDITNVANGTTPNEYGVMLIWGDTVGGTNGNNPGVIGAAADRAYGQAGRLINNYQLTIGGTVYDMNFEAGALAPVAEPISMIFFGTGLVAVGGFMARRRMQKA